MTADLVGQLVDGFNRHGAFTARRMRWVDGSSDLTNGRVDEFAAQVRYADTGELAATVWLPSLMNGGQVQWLAARRGLRRPIRFLPESATVEEVVRAVATHVLDEAVKR